MNDAPERIWADQDNLTWVEVDPDEVMRRNEACYLRADLVLDLMRKARAVMRECGWHLAPGSATSGDGILEAAAAEIEGEFAQWLGDA